MMKRMAAALAASKSPNKSAVAKDLMALSDAINGNRKAEAYLTNKLAGGRTHKGNSNFELTDSRWNYDKKKDLTANFTFKGRFDGKPFEFTVPVEYSLSMKKDSDGRTSWSYISVDISDEPDCTTGCTLKLDGVEVLSSDELYERFLDEKDLSDQEHGWSSLSDSLREDAQVSNEAKAFAADYADNAEEAEDPYGYRGLSREDFI